MVTLTLPDVPEVITAVMLVEETTLNEAADVPPKLTAVAPMKSVPVIVTIEPIVPEVGVKEVIVGVDGVVYVNPANEEVPPGLVTLMLPDVPAATRAVMHVGEMKLNTNAAVPPKLTADAPEKSVPVIVTNVPVVPEVGEKEVMAGAGVITLFLITETVLEPILATAISGLPSPFKSPMEIQRGLVPAV